ncbi:MAG: MBL fold metallo-hydrolase [Clostridia bacterium]|nr:MBL fold metallo-hydrolase [Clostridia bacterium]
MEIECITAGATQSNCYIVNTDKVQLIVDPALFNDELRAYIDAAPNKERYILLTHRHFDHVGGAADIKEYCAAKIVIHNVDAQGLYDTEFSMGDVFGIKHKPTSADILVDDGQQLNLGDLNVKVLHTPGHTAGSVCFIIDRIIFTGDTLFCGTIGRYDFPSGDFKTILKSIERLVKLSGDYDLYPGHMDCTTLQYEREHNPYIVGRIL